MKYLFCCLAGHGHVYPMIGIALELKSRGHEVAFATHMDFAGVLREADIQRIPRGEKDGPSFHLEGWGQKEMIALQVLHLEHAMRVFQPEVLVGGQLTLGAHIVSDVYKAPLAVLGFAAYFWRDGSPETLSEGDDPNATPPDSYLDPPGDVTPAWADHSQDTNDSGVSQTAAVQAGMPAYAGMLRKLNRARNFVNLPMLDWRNGESPLLGDVFLLQSVPELEGDIDELPARVHCVGSCLWELPGQVDSLLTKRLGDAHSGGEPILYVQPGRSFDKPSFWPYFMEAFADRPVFVAAAVSRLDIPSGVIPSNFHVRDFVPIKRVARYANGVISGGHTTAALGALTNGLPALHIAWGSGTNHIAKRCARVGAALQMTPFEVSTEELRRVVKRLVESDSIRLAAERMQKAFAQHNGHTASANLLERLGRERRPILRD